ncbi:hypothetical protein [Thiolapillus sp.]|uniref:hypothetical protein n=1 Tax=Thiolapillus sp. TaxID=2017437 RepID=UPI0035A8A59F
MKYTLIALFGLLLAVSSANAADSKAVGGKGTEASKTLHWAGCGITKKAFMKELAAEYERIYGVHFELEGGGAKGIRHPPGERAQRRDRRLLQAQDQRRSRRAFRAHDTSRLGCTGGHGEQGQSGIQYQPASGKGTV